MRPPADTARLTFRELTPDDIDFVFSVRSDAEIMRFYPKTDSRDECLAWIEKHRQKYENIGYGFWLISLKSSKQPVGLAGITWPDVDGVLEPEIGYIFHKQFWRQGLASEAALAIRDFAFDVVGRPHVLSLIRPENIASQGVARKMGMRLMKRSMHEGLEHLVFGMKKQERG